VRVSAGIEEGFAPTGGFGVLSEPAECSELSELLLLLLLLRSVGAHIALSDCIEAAANIVLRDKVAKKNVHRARHRTY